MKEDWIWILAIVIFSIDIVLQLKGMTKGANQKVHIIFSIAVIVLCVLMLF